MKQIQYVLIDIIKNKRVTAIFIIQMIVFYFLLTSMFISISSTLAGLKAIEDISNSSTYVLSDYTTDEHQQELFTNQDTSLPLVQTLYKTILDSNISQYSRYSYTYREKYHGVEIQQYTANNSFFELFHIEYADGHGFVPDDYSKHTTNEVIPIVVGYMLQDYYRLGQTYELVDCGTGSPITCKVVGILKNNTSFYNLYYLNTPINLNYSFIKPLMDAKELSRNK